MNQNHGIYIAAKGLNVLNLPTSPLSQIWEVKAPPKMLFFLWLCSYNSIPVREVLGSKSLRLDQSCPIYRSHLESRDNLLKECSFSVSFWNQLGPPSSLYSSFGSLSKNGSMQTARPALILGTTTSLGPFYSYLESGFYE